MIIQGKVHSVESFPAGTRVVNDYVIASTVLEVASTSPLQDPGTVSIADALYTYTISTTVPNTIVLGTGLEVAIEDGEAVLVYPAAVEKTAFVYTDDDQDAIVAVVPHFLQANFAEGSRDDEERESVLVEEVRGVWQIQNIVGLESDVEADEDSGKANYNELTVNGIDTNGDEAPDRGFSIYGTEFLDWLDALPKGQIAYGNRNNVSNYLAADQVVHELQADIVRGRQYEVTCSGNVRNDTASQRSLVVLRYTIDGTTPSTINGNKLQDWRNVHVSAGQILPFHIHRTIYFSPDNVSTFYGDPIDLRLACVVGIDGGSGLVSSYGSSTAPIELSINDVGLLKLDTGIDRTAASPPVTKKTYTTTWTSTSACCYMASGAKDSSQGSQDMKQGYSSYDGDSRSLWIFPNTITSTLSGSTVSKIRVYLYANHWYYNAGGTARVKVHGQTSIPATAPSMTTALDSSGWAINTGRWVTLPSSLHAGFIAGTYKGVGVGPAGTTSQTYYGRFNYSGAKIEITYTK